MALVSPGVEVNVIDESFYTPAGAGTVPIIFIATAENKTSASGSGTAVGTLKANAGKPYLITSQRELGETFGDAIFYKDSNNNMIHGGELNEYGLNTAYSLLGVSNRVYVCRADLDVSKLQAQAVAPGGEPVNGSYWLDTRVTSFGVLEWNGSAITVAGGQAFTSVTPIAIVDANQLVGNAPGATPRTSVGAVGDYAVDTTTTDNTLWYKAAVGPSKGSWVEVGSEEWKASWATVTGTVANPTLTDGKKIEVDGTTVTLSSLTGSLNDFVADFNTAMTATGVTAANVDGFLEIYSDNATLVIGPDGADTTLITQLGLTAGTYNTPAVAIAPHTSVPLFKTAEQNRPTGSLWLKTTQPNAGANFKVKRYNGDTQIWDNVVAPVYQTAEDAIYQLNSTGGGLGLILGDLYVKANASEATDKLGNWTIFRRAANDATRITSGRIESGTISAGTYTFTMLETRTGNNKYWPRSNVGTVSEAVAPVTVSYTAAGTSADADTLAGAINAAGLTNVVASVEIISSSVKRVLITHKLGGEIKFVDTTGGLNAAGFGVTTTNLYYEPGYGSGSSPKRFRASNWKPLSYVADNDEPLTLAEDGALWYSSVVDEIDIMVHDGSTWVGYKNEFPNTDPAGPIVSASEPETQSDGTDLVNNDLWIDTADIENFPTIYRYNTINGWVLVDKTDQTTEEGVLFADARYGADGGSVTTGLDAAEIVQLLESDYLDPDAPDSALYPKGMLLWNLRRSGFNVKRFVRNYIDIQGTNSRYLDESMDAYYPHRWVTDSGNNEDGSGTFGRHAQRKSVVQALQALVNSNQDIRDEDSRYFNLIACPGYPELIGEMITLNYDRRLTAFVVGDTPARLTPDATSLNEWGANVRRAVEDNDDGAVSFDEYMAMYYPWGFTSDNAGNNVVVPPSHMALRTIILNDQVAFPWFAPAGTRRGGVTNATASGYINSEGEFVSIALNTGQRDTLYSNAINPITFISGAGLVVFGQKTRARNASALDRVNVARLIVYMRGQLEKLARPYLFEPNDKITRDQIKAAADAFCLELVSLRALYDYLVVCDESNNTPSRIDRNELYLDIAIEPVKAVEFIYIPLRIKNTGEIAALG